MKFSRLLLLFGVVLVGIAVGWVYQSQTKDNAQQVEVEIPIDIDYYLSVVNYRVMNEDGNLDYRLITPYLEHFRGSDISKIQTPKFDVYREDEHWKVSSESAEILHKVNTIDFHNNVFMEKQGAETLSLSATTLRFESDIDLITGRQNVVLTSKNSKIEAEMAVFDLENKIYRLTKTRTIYHDEKS